MKILFVCTHNACRSVLAEVIARKLGEGRIETASAGSNPAGRIHPLTLEYLESEGHTTEGLESQSFADVEAFAPDAVITDIKATSKKQALEEMSRRAAKITGIHERAIFDVLLERERLGKKLTRFVSVHWEGFTKLSKKMKRKRAPRLHSS